MLGVLISIVDHPEMGVGVIIRTKKRAVGTRALSLASAFPLSIQFVKNQTNFCMLLASSLDQTNSRLTISDSR